MVTNPLVGFDVMQPTPESVDLRGDRRMPEVWDQGSLGSCTAHSVGAAYAFAVANSLRESASKVPTPSRLWIYYQERVLEGTVNADAGAEIRDGFKVISSLGVPPEKDWPYDVAKFAQRPPELAGLDAAKHKATKYVRVAANWTAMIRSIAAGYPVSFGFTVYESFESDQVAKTGVAPIPLQSEQVLGGHAVLAIGYDKAKRVLYVRNSWGKGWGQDGYFEMPSQFFDLGLISDCWACEVAS
jgi:C1A family cysteine protease